MTGFGESMQTALPSQTGSQLSGESATSMPEVALSSPPSQSKKGHSPWLVKVILKFVESVLTPPVWRIWTRWPSRVTSESGNACAGDTGKGDRLRAAAPNEPINSPRNENFIGYPP